MLFAAQENLITLRPGGRREEGYVIATYSDPDVCIVPGFLQETFLILGCALSSIFLVDGESPLSILSLLIMAKVQGLYSQKLS